MFTAWIEGQKRQPSAIGINIGIEEKPLTEHIKFAQNVQKYQGNKTCKPKSLPDLTFPVESISSYCPLKLTLPFIYWLIKFFFLETAYVKAPFSIDPQREFTYIFINRGSYQFN